MATNVTTDTELYFEQRLNVATENLYKCISRISNYNENVLPVKNKHLEEDLERKREKRAARPDKYEGKAPLPVKARVYEPIDIDTNEEFIGLKREIESIRYILYSLNPIKYKNYKLLVSEFSIEDYIKYIEKNINKWDIRLSCANNRLEAKRVKLVQNKKNNPKKYSNRPDLPEVNREMINDRRCLDHYRLALYKIKATDKRLNGLKVSMPVQFFDRPNRNNRIYSSDIIKGENINGD